MNPDPDYSAAYVVLGTDAGDGLEGHGFAFTIGRGNDVQVAAIDALAPWSSAATSTTCSRPGRLRPRAHRRRASCAGSARRRASCTWRSARWSTRSGTCAPSAPGKPLWQLLAELTPEQLVDLVDFRYLTDALTPRRGAGDPARPPSRAGRSASAQLLRDGLSGLHDDARAGSATPTRSSRGCAGRRSPTGFTQIKLKVGGDLDDDIRRLRHRPRGGRPGHPHRGRRQPALGRRRGDRLDRRSCAASTRTGSRSRPARTTSSATPRSGAAVAPIRVATGEHVQNRVMFKQLLQAGADRRRADRRLPRRRRQREHRDPAAGGQVRRAGLPARRRRRPVRAGPAPVDVRLRRRLRRRIDGPGRSSTSTTCTSTSSTRSWSRTGATSRRPCPGYSTQLRAESIAEY